MDSDFIRLTVVRAFVTNTLAFAAMLIQDRLQGEFGRTWTTVWCFALVFIAAVLAEYTARQLIEKSPTLRRFFFVAARLEGWWLHEWETKSGGREGGLMHIKLENGQLAVKAYCMAPKTGGGGWEESGVLTSQAVRFDSSVSNPQLTIAYQYESCTSSQVQINQAFGYGRYTFHLNSYTGTYIDTIDNTNLTLYGTPVRVAAYVNQLNTSDAKKRPKIFGELLSLR